MSDAHAHSPGDRVLLLALTTKDAAVARDLLGAAGIDVESCATFAALLHELESGAAVLAIAEEKMSVEDSARLAAVLREQPPWSDLPVLLFTRPGADSPVSRDAVLTLGNVTLLERPLRVTALLSAVRSAVRARQRQYQIRSHLDERERAAEALRVADQRKDEFLATLGHELRNPLAPLLTGLHLLRMTSNRDPGIARITAVMERQLTHLVRLVDDLLEVSRITRGVIDVQREPLDLATLVRSALETTRPMFEAAGHRLTVDLPELPISIQGDSVRLTQVFANLLTNAAKYTNAGGSISVTVRRAGERAVIAVRDNGIGIPTDHLDSVFDMFMQVDRSNRRSQGGLGIGLTLVRSLVTMHGGTVQARSAGPGRGSEFVVTLPVTAQQAARAEQPRSIAMFPPRRILVVDDNQDAADTLGSLLTALGATVAVVHGGAAALEAFSTFNPDTVLLDLGMPGMDGYDVARRIRAMEGHPDTLLIALTGWGQDHDYRQSRAAGFDHHLVKPPDIEHLRELLSEGWTTPPGVAGGGIDEASPPSPIRH
jgi:signal transduction histidine kinase/ActR/RegA family two-component response regulator